MPDYRQTIRYEFNVVNPNGPDEGAGITVTWWGDALPGTITEEAVITAIRGVMEGYVEPGFIFQSSRVSNLIEDYPIAP